MYVYYALAQSYTYVEYHTIKFPYFAILYVETGNLGTKVITWY